MEKICELLDIRPHIKHTERYESKENFMALGGVESLGASKTSGSLETLDDFRDVIRPKHPLPDASFTPRRYYQVFEQKHGFLPNLSILDLLMNEGNESVFFL
jgi:hypothetical protein